jgi:hypothetical protein
MVELWHIVCSSTRMLFVVRMLHVSVVRSELPLWV